jgi:hypothetical protein
MPVDHIRYDLLTQDALRGVIRTVLTDAAVKGLPGDHHFFITFDTRAEGVRISSRLKTSYPDEMTIVLQHQFWDLQVGDDDFDVGLAFNAVPERLHVPFKAVKAFFDPSVQFGLQFTVESDGEAKGKETKSGAKAGPKAKTTTLEALAPPRTDPKPAVAGKKPKSSPSDEAAKPAAANAAEPEAPETPPPAAGGEVVRLDRFRKK